MLTLERPNYFDMVNEGTPPHFGEWLRLKIEGSGMQLVDFAHHIRMAYPNFSDILNRNAPRKEITIKRIVDGLVELEIIDDPSEAWTRARIVPEGYVVRPEHDSFLEAGHAIAGLIDPAAVAANDYLRRVGGFSGEQEYTEEQLEKLRKGMDMVVAGWWAEQVREKQKREDKKGPKK
ncbi:MAG: hypothetical protein ABIY70_08860 [Capsulimonas sp.]|uniref:hypothetical protein n=1 Tax=Capsulimonas sp. TaxID=2494211 RepID=UPI003265AFA2